MRTRQHDGPPIRWGWILAVAIGWLLGLWLTRGDANGAEFIVSCVIDRHDSYDFHGTQFFELHCGPQHGAFMVSADADLPVTKWLASQDKQRVSVSLGGRE